MSFVKPLNFPKVELKISKKEDVIFVWCIIRKKNLVLTPEEWVRQHTIHFLINELSIPKERIASEQTISVNNLTRRCDVVVIDKNGNASFIIECKAPEIEITENVFYQIAQYNRNLKAKYLMLTNGLKHVYCEINQSNGEINFLENLNEIEW